MWTKEHGKGRTRTIYVYSHAAKSVPQNVSPPLPRARGKTDVTKQLNNTKTCLKRN